MAGVTRAFFLMTLNRYFGMAIGFFQIAVLSRLLSPAEIGVTAVGVAVTTISSSVREFTSLGYLIQQPTITALDKRAGATLILLSSLAISLGCFFAAPLVEQAYAREGVAQYIAVIALAMMIEAVSMPRVALMRRDMAFGKVASLDITNGVVFTIVVVPLAATGASFHAFAWAWVASAAACALLSVILRPEWGMFAPTLKAWGGPLRFGAFSGVAALLQRTYDSIPPLVFGRTMGLFGLGAYSRALTITQLPDKLILGGLLSVLFPAFSRAFAAGEDLKAIYLRGLSLISGVYWPCGAMVALLASPIVALLLGPQWQNAADLVRLIALGWLFSFANDVTLSLLFARGEVKANLLRSAIIWPTSGLVLIAASAFGPLAVAASYLIVVPFQAFVSFLFIRRMLGVSVAELWRALRGSVFVTAGAVSAGGAVAALLGGAATLSVAEAIAAGSAAVAAWAVLLFCARHALSEEAVRIWNAGRARFFSQGAGA